MTRKTCRYLNGKWLLTAGKCQQDSSTPVDNLYEKLYSDILVITCRRAYDYGYSNGDNFLTFWGGYFLRSYKRVLIKYFKTLFLETNNIFLDKKYLEIWKPLDLEVKIILKRNLREKT